MQKIKLSLPQPCHENWNNMTPSDHGRFCKACAKSVIDFSSMSDAELLNYFTRTKDYNICGRVYPDQLERSIQTLASKKPGWRWNYIFAFFFLFTKSNNAKAQGEVKISKTSKPDSTNKNGQANITTGELYDVPPVRLGKINMSNKPLPANTMQEPVTLPKSCSMEIVGRITNENGEPIPAASIIVLPAGTGLSANGNGTFSATLDPAKSSLKISAIGYEEKIITNFDTLHPTIILKESSIKMGEVVVTADIQKRMMGGIMGGLAITRSYSLRDTLKNCFSTANPAINIYPNPAQKGGTVKVELKLKPGSYRLQILDASGRILEQKQVKGASGKIIEQLHIEKTWTGGNYFIRVFDGKNKIVENAGFLVL